MGTYVQVGETIEKTMTLTVADISAFAAQIEDHNPLHHDAEYAAGTRFGGIIASGPHVSSLFMALTATYFSQRGVMLGLNFTLEFRAAALAGEPLTMRWQVVDVLFKESLGGDVVTLEGLATDSNGGVVLFSKGQVLVTDKL